MVNVLDFELNVFELHLLCNVLFSSYTFKKEMNPLYTLGSAMS